MKHLIPQGIVEKKIFSIRGSEVMLDRDLAESYGISTKVLNQAVKRNQERFPEELMFRLTKEEHDSLRSQIVTLKQGQHRKYLPFVFTEYGALMLATVLRSKTAIEASFVIIKGFIKFRETVVTQKEIFKKLSNIERKIVGQDKSLKFAFKLIYELASDPDAFRPKRPRKVIEGFGAHKKKKK